MATTILTIAGSDPGGGAGLQADLSTFAAMGADGRSVVTALTAQDAGGVRVVRPVDAGMLRAQLEVALDDAVDAVKLGMLATAEIVAAVAEALDARPGLPVVCDPVLAASDGTSLLEPEAIPLLCRRLLPRVDVLTPNVPEAERLSGGAVGTARDAVAAALRLREQGAGAVVITGGHRLDRPGADLIVSRDGTQELSRPWLEDVDAHGSGCVFASALAVGLARGLGLAAAVRGAGEWVRRLRLDPGGRRSVPGPLHVLVDGERLAAAAAAGGADVLQWRDKSPATTRERVRRATAIRRLGEAAGSTLIVNDYAEVACAVDAGLHLGAEDLAPEQARRLLGPGAIVGATANNLEQAERSAATPVSYLGVGPVFGTRSKARPAPQLGLAALERIVRAVPLPVIAIGNIDAERVGSVLETGVAGVAVLGAVASAADPESATREIREAIRRHRIATARQGVR